MNNVLASCPYFIFNRPILLKVMPKLFEFGNEELFKVPVWTRLQNLPLELWNGQALSKIVSRVGKPIRTDQQTAARSAISFARVLVEIDVSKPLKTEVSIKLPGGKMLCQSLEYERAPVFCHHCNMVGHKSSKCGVHHREVKENPEATEDSAPAQKVNPEPSPENEEVGSPSADQMFNSMFV